MFMFIVESFNTNVKSSPKNNNFVTCRTLLSKLSRGQKWHRAIPAIFSG